MTRTIASLALLACTLIAGCAADQSGATSPGAKPEQAAAKARPASAARPAQY